MSPKVAWKTDEAIVEKVIGLVPADAAAGGRGADPAAGDLRRRLDSSWLNFKNALRPLSRLMDEEPLKGGKCEHVSGTCATGRLLRALADALKGGDGFPGLEDSGRQLLFLQGGPGRASGKESPRLIIGGRFIAAYRPAQQALREAGTGLQRLQDAALSRVPGEFHRSWEEGKKTLFVEEFSQTLARLFVHWSEEAFPYLYLKMSDRFRNFLFDEFQDTSTLQFKALAPLIDEVLSREKNASLFIVGDRKQAIYRWRGGNSELMEESLLRRAGPGHRQPVAGERSPPPWTRTGAAAGRSSISTTASGTRRRSPGSPVGTRLQQAIRQ